MKKLYTIFLISISSLFIAFSSFIKIFTGPDGRSLALTPKSIATKTKIININMMALISIYV